MAVQASTCSSSCINNRICAEPCVLLSHRGEVISTTIFDGRVQTLTVDEAAFLSRIRQFAPASDHVRAEMSRYLAMSIARLRIPRRFRASLLSRMVSASDNQLGWPSIWAQRALSNVTQQIATLAEKGMLVSERQVLTDLGRSEVPRTSDSRTFISRICIPTAERPRLLRRCIESCLQHLKLHQREHVRVLVIEDSHDRSLANHNRAVCSEVDATYKYRVIYCGPRFRKELVDKLIRKTNISSDIVRFALEPDTALPTDGATRNVIALITQGVRILQVDDDTIFRYSKVGGPGTARISSESDPYETFFYSTHSKNVSEHPPDSSIDIIPEYDGVLGAQIGDIVKTREFGLGILSQEALLNLRSGCPRVDVVTAGCLGHSGMYSGAGLLIEGGDKVYKRLSCDEEGYETACERPEVFRAVLQLSIVRTPRFQAMSHAANHAQLLPPYFPLGRNTDGLWGLTYKVTDSNVWLAHLPYAIEHCPERNRPYFVHRTNAYGRVRITDVIALCTAATSMPCPVTRREGLRCLGVQLIAIGRLPLRCFESHLREIALKDLSMRIKILEAKLDEIQTSDKRRIDFQTMIKRMKSALIDDRSLVPLDLPQGLSLTSSLEITKRYVELYGELLISWEELAVAASTIYHLDSIWDI